MTRPTRSCCIPIIFVSCLLAPFCLCGLSVSINICDFWRGPLCRIASLSGHQSMGFPLDVLRRAGDFAGLALLHSLLEGRGWDLLA